jgi:hypothetical protein
VKDELEHRPGNSSSPPSGPLPAYVSSAITKSGSQIAGDTAHIWW